MYCYEERIRAVKLYIKLGEGLGATLLKLGYTLAELLAELDLPRSSYFYHCARLKGPDKYADARIAIADVF